MTAKADKQIQESSGILDYLKMIKFSHSIFALPFAGIGLIEVIFVHGIEWNHRLLLDAFLVLVCMVSLRSAAMGFNRIADRKIDAENPRTKNREIPAGTIPLSQAWIFTVLFLVLFAVCAYLINPLTGALAPLAIVLVLGYSYTKRFTFLCHFVLGAAIGLAPSAVWIALSGSIEILPVLWSAGLAFYIAGFDILYSCQDREFDKGRNLHSIPVRFGVPASLVIARISHMAALGFFISTIFFTEQPVGPFYIAGIVAAAVLFFFEHYLVRGGRLENIPVAFFNVNAYVSTVLFTGVLFNRILPILNLV